jgi:ABC-type glycerol-3-phosphate transport system permease component
MTSLARSRRLTFAIYGMLTAASIVWLVPVATALMTSLRPLEEIRDGWWNLDGATFTLSNYSKAWEQGLSEYVVNSFLIALASVALTLSAGVFAAYSFSRLRFRFRRGLYLLLLTTMIVPVQIILIPLLPWFQTLGLSEGAWQYLGIALVHTAFGAGLAVFILTPFFAEVPDEIVDAARVDGASHLDVFRRVILPLAVPGIVSFAIIDFVFVWNDLLLALTLLGREFQPLTVGLANLQSPHLAQEDVVSAGAIMAIVPPLLLFALLNRYYVRGLFAGGVKG